MKKKIQDACRVLLLVLVALTATTQNSSAATRVWTGASATSGNWTTAANWEGGVAPTAGDVLQFVDTGARKTANTNNFPAGRTFSVINCFGNGYRLRGNRVTITNSMNVGNPAGSHIVDLDVTLGALDGSVSMSSFDAAANLTMNGDVNLGSQTLITDGAGDITIAGVISGTGSVFKNNTGSLSFSGLGANTYSGPTTVARGILRLNRYNITGGLTFVGATAIAGNLSIGDFVSTLIGDIVVLERDNQIANTSTVSVNATGSLELSDENDTVGELRLRGGTVLTGTGSLGVEGGIYATSPLNVTKDSLIAGHLTLGARGDGPQIIDVAQGVQLNIAAQISGVSTADLIKTNRGELVLTASNIFSGDVEIVGGTVVVSHGSALGNTNGITRLGLGTIVLHEVGVPEVLEVTGSGATLTVDSFGGSWNGSVILNDDLIVNVPTNRSVSITGQISGPAGWTKFGPGNLVFRTTYTHTYMGAGEVRQGDLVLENVFSQTVIPGPLVIGDGNGGANADRVRMLFGEGIGNTSAVTINSSGQLVMSGHNDTIGSLAGSGNVSLGDGTLTVGANNTSTVFSGVISDAGSLVKSGSAMLTLTGNNTYTGVTTNQSGTLSVNGMLSGSPVVQVRPGSVLGGTGQVQAISVFVNGVIRPGASPGNLSASTVLLSSGALDVELNGLVPGLDYDRLTSSGTVTLGGALQVSLGFAPALGSSFMILNKTSPGVITGTFSELTEGATFALGGLLFQITYTGGNGNDVVLTRVAAPASDINSISPITPERMQIFGQGVPFVTYILEATPHFNAPIPWVPVATNSANALGIYELIDAYASGGMTLYPARFYRVQSP